MPAGDAESTINQTGEKLLQGKAAKHNHKDTFVVIIIQSLLIRYVFNEPRQNKQYQKTSATVERIYYH